MAQAINIYEKLTSVQADLKAPKNQFNSFGKYKYRNCEDILEALKPLLVKYKLTLTLSDSMQIVAERYYLTAMATLINSENPGEIITASAIAREPEIKKGMDSSQITGATSSYARKYCLSGLFAIDDTKDADSLNNNQSQEISTSQQKKLNDLISQINHFDPGRDAATGLIKYLKVPSLKAIPQDKFLQACSVLKTVLADTAQKQGVHA